MLKRLFISNYALIEKLEMEFDSGFTIITGETGAGKSVLLGALSLIIGNRAEREVLYDKKSKCIIEGVFDISNYPAKVFFDQHELDYEEQTIVRREINPEGKSRSFINDTPVKLSQLKTLGMLLVDIHSQNDSFLLNNADYQLKVIDAFAGHEQLLKEFLQLYNDYTQTGKNLQELKDKEKQAKKDEDYFKFQFEELENAALVPGEESTLEQELEVLKNAAEIKEKIFNATSGLDNGEGSVLDNLNTVVAEVGKAAGYYNPLADIHSRIKSAHIELRDIAADLEMMQEKITHDPSREEVISERIDLVFRLQQKHGVNSNEALLAIKDELDEKLQNIGSVGNQIKELEEKFTRLEKKATALAEKISLNRKKAIPYFEKKANGILSRVGMEDASVKVQVQHQESLQKTGIDNLNFLFSPNKGVAFQSLNKIASGGERSRVMLAVKSQVADLTALPTIIFDEIDTGVSGEVAGKVGQILKNMSHSMQVISITHLPQIAAKGNSHYRVKKEIKSNKAVTVIEKLTQEERIEELAKMLSGEKMSAAAIENAKSLFTAGK